MQRLLPTQPKLGLTLAACLLLTLGIAACHDTAVDPEVSSDYDGQTLFRGIVLGQGEVAQLIPEIRDHYMVENFATSDEQLREIFDFQDRLLAAIAVSDPAYFEGFKTVMESGDHLRIQRKLDESALVVWKAIMTLPEGRALLVHPEGLAAHLDLEATAEIAALMDIDVSTLDAAEVEEALAWLASQAGGPADKAEEVLQPTFLAIACAIFFAVAVHNVAAVTATVAAAVAVTVKLALPDRVAAEGLLEEQLINSIALTL